MRSLSTEQRRQVIALLCDGQSTGTTARLTGVAKNTIVKLLFDLGAACAKYQDEITANLQVQRIDTDEIWSFSYARQQEIPDEYKGTFGYGDIWTWIAIDRENKLATSWLVGERTTQDCYAFLADLKSRLRVGAPIRLATDGLGIYPSVVNSLWGDGIDHEIMKEPHESAPSDATHRISSAERTDIEFKIIKVDPASKNIGASHVELQGLTIRMGMRRFSRLTDGFSRKIELLTNAVSLFYMHYNFCRPHQALTTKYGKSTTPAMSAGFAEYEWSITEMIERVFN
ncbi:MAG: hypothetical protein WC864_05665 [Ilumatobacteraceae bacterium]